jgi:hypothetical protein
MTSFTRQAVGGIPIAADACPVGGLPSASFRRLAKLYRATGRGVYDRCMATVDGGEPVRGTCAKRAGQGHINV